MISVHPTAVIDPAANIGAGCVVGPYCVIGPNVKIGENNRIASHVVIDGFTTIGCDNLIYQFASIGSAPQDLKFKGEASRLEIGDKNTIREYVTLQPGTSGGGMLTSIGSGNLLMVNSHVGHDCQVGDCNVFANSVALAGHVTVGSNVILGGLSAVHQFVRLGDLSFLGGGAMVNMDVPPYCIVEGNRAGLVGLNTIGMERKGFTTAQVEQLKKFFRELFLGSGIFKDRLAEAKKAAKDFIAAEKIIEFIESSERGICSTRRINKE